MDQDTNNAQTKPLTTASNGTGNPNRKRKMKEMDTKLSHHYLNGSSPKRLKSDSAPPRSHTMIEYDPNDIKVPQFYYDNDDDEKDIIKPLTNITQSAEPCNKSPIATIANIPTITTLSSYSTNNNINIKKETNNNNNNIKKEEQVQVQEEEQAEEGEIQNVMPFSMTIQNNKNKNATAIATAPFNCFEQTQLQQQNKHRFNLNINTKYKLNDNNSNSNNNNNNNTNDNEEGQIINNDPAIANMAIPNDDGDGDDVDDDIKSHASSLSPKSIKSEQENHPKIVTITIKPLDNNNSNNNNNNISNSNSKMIKKKKSFPIRLLLDAKRVGGLIGKGGVSITKIRATSGGKILIAKPIPHSLFRICSVEGDYNEIVTAINLIIDKMAEESTRLPPYNITILVEEKNIGCLIGKQGKAITEIRNKTNANIYISSHLLRNSSEKTVDICGDRNAVHNAICLVIKRLLQNPSYVTTRMLYDPQMDFITSPKHNMINNVGIPIIHQPVINHINGINGLNSLNSINSINNITAAAAAGLEQFHPTNPYSYYAQTHGVLGANPLINNHHPRIMSISSPFKFGGIPTTVHPQLIPGNTHTNAHILAPLRANASRHIASLPSLIQSNAAATSHLIAALQNQHHRSLPTFNRNNRNNHLLSSNSSLSKSCSSNLSISNIPDNNINNKHSARSLPAQQSQINNNNNNNSNNNNNNNNKLNPSSSQINFNNNNHKYNRHNNNNNNNNNPYFQGNRNNNKYNISGRQAQLIPSWSTTAEKRNQYYNPRILSPLNNLNGLPHAIQPIQQAHSTVVVLPVASHLIGGVIGRGGRNIQEIRRQTNAEIKIDNERQNQTNERYITINGTPQQISTAVYMIQNSLATHT